MILQNTAKPFTGELGKCFLLCPDFRKAFVGCSCTSGFFRCKAALYDRFLSLPDAFYIDPDRYICHAAADKRACMGKTKMQLSFLRKKRLSIALFCFRGAFPDQPLRLLYGR